MNSKEKLMMYMLGWKNGTGASAFTIEDKDFKDGYEDGRHVKKLAYARACAKYKCALSPLRSLEIKSVNVWIDCVDGKTTYKFSGDPAAALKFLEEFDHEGSSIALSRNAIGQVYGQDVYSFLENELL